jgi:hypothetical protein
MMSKAAPSSTWDEAIDNDYSNMLTQMTTRKKAAKVAARSPRPHSFPEWIDTGAI